MSQQKKRWIDFRSQVLQRNHIAPTMEKLLVGAFRGKIEEVLPYIGGSTRPTAIVHTTVTFVFDDEGASMDTFIEALKRELEPQGISLDEWWDDGDLPWNLWSWIKGVFRDITFQHR